jgi:hypothetical protein
MGHNLGGPESTAGGMVAAFVRDEHASGAGDEIDEIEPRNHFAVGPTPKIRAAIEPVVERSRETKASARRASSAARLLVTQAS